MLLATAPASAREYAVFFAPGKVSAATVTLLPCSVAPAPTSAASVTNTRLTPTAPATPVFELVLTEVEMPCVLASAS